MVLQYHWRGAIPIELQSIAKCDLRWSPTDGAQPLLAQSAPVATSMGLNAVGRLRKT